MVIRDYGFFQKSTKLFVIFNPQLLQTPFLVFQFCSIASITFVRMSLLLEYISLKLIGGDVVGEGFTLWVLHSFSLWLSLSGTLQVLHRGFDDPLKFVPHSNIPNLAIIIVLVSCFVHSKSLSWTFRVYMGLLILSIMCAVFVLGVVMLSLVL